MPGAKPALIIPIRLDADEAIKTLKKLGDEGDEAGKKTGKSLSSAEKEGEALIGRFQNMIGVGAGLSAVANVVGTIASGLMEAAANSMKMAQEFANFRRMTADMAGLQGKGASNEFTLEKIKLAEEAGISPTKLAQYQQGLDETIAGNIGPGKQLTQGQANTIAQKVAAFGVARGLSPEAIAQLVGSITRQTQAGPNADQEVLTKFGQIVNLMDTAPGKVEKLLPELSQVMATGVNAEEAATQISVMAGRGRPGESGTYAVALQRAIRGLFTEDKSGESKAAALGIGKEMTDTQAARVLYQQAQAAGVNLTNSRDVALWLDKQGVKETEGQQALQAMFNLGFGQRGVENAAAAIQAGGIQAVDDSITRFATSDEGRQQAAENATEIARLRQGVRLQGWMTAKEKAKGELTTKSRLTQYGGQELLEDWAPDALFGTREELAINRQAIQNLEQQAIQAGVDAQQLPYGGKFVPPISPGVAQDHGAKILELIEQNTRKQPAPLSAPPPNPVTRTSG